MTGDLEAGRCQGWLDYLFVLADCIVPENTQLELEVKRSCRREKRVYMESGAVKGVRDDDFVPDHQEAGREIREYV